MLQNLRQAMRRQLRRRLARRGSPSFSRRLTPLWMRPTAGLAPPGSAQGLQSYQSVGGEGPQLSPCSGGGVGDAGAPPECFAMVDLQHCLSERSASPLSSQIELELSPLGRVSSRAWSRSSSRSEPPLIIHCEPAAPNRPPPTVREVYRMCGKRISRKLAVELASNLRGVSLVRYSSLGPLSPLSPQPQTSTSSFHSQGQDVTSSPEPSSSATEEDNSRHVTVQVLHGGTRGGDGKRSERRSQSRLRTFNRALNDEEGDSGTEMTPF